jgi:uncharacterized hydrophobic protein (TIGR00271 family)
MEENSKKRWLDYLKLEGEVDDFDKIHTTIEKDIIFKGTNLWILVFAIIVASVGLNMNSTAVIIGAMLISPLMGPINGMGYSIATYNFPLFKKAIKNFTFAVGASLVASTVYFAISPISTAYSELLARTSPTIYDVLIAMFGGLAGIVAISSKHKGNVIPGVAIATALMPPLCTAGYGLATGQFNYFFGAIYLFTINTVFIAIASMVVSQILKFPILTVVDPTRKTVVNRWITVVIIITVIPSLYFGYGLVVNQKFSDNASGFVRNVTEFEGNFLLRHEVKPERKEIILYYAGNELSKEQIDRIKNKANDFGLPENTKLVINQGLSFRELDANTIQLEKIRTELQRVKTELREKENLINDWSNKHQVGEDLLSEIKTLYPQTDVCIFSDGKVFGEKLDTLVDGREINLVVFHSYTKLYSDEEKAQIRKWVRKRLKTEAIRVYFFY